MLRPWSYAAIALVLAQGACDKKTAKSTGAAKPPTAQESGCIQGVAVNGLTGERAGLRGGVPNSGVFVLVRNQLLQAVLVVDDPSAPDANPSLIGEYHLCGIPLDEDFPVFVWLEGYQPFESLVHVRSTAPGRSTNAEEDIVRADPSELINVRLYPKSTDAKDLVVVVHYDGAPLANATVTLRAIGANFLDPAGTDYLPPRNVRSQTLRVVTDPNGRAAFPAAELVLGGHYTYTVLPPDGGAAQTAVASELFVLGLRGEEDKAQPYRIDVNLLPSVTELVELSRSSDSQDPDPTGRLVIYFNREIEVVPGTEDGMLAELSGATTALLELDVPDNKTPETVRATFEANRLTLEPVLKTLPSPDISTELTLAVKYENIQVRPKSSPHTLKPLTVDGTVRFYR